LELASPCCARWSVDGLDFAAIATLGAVTVPRLGSITGHVRREEAEDEPLAESRVCAETQLPDDRTPRCAESDSEGDFVLDGVEPGRYTVTAEHPGRLKVTRRAVEVEPARLSNLGEVLLPLGASIRLVVLDAETSAPVQGARVRLFHPDPSLPWAKVAEVETDEHGLATLSGVPEGVQALQVQASAYASQRLDAVARVEDIEPETIWLTGGGTLSGSVYRDGLPATGDNIVVELVGETRSARVDLDGHYTVPNLPPGRVGVGRTSPSRSETELRDATIVIGKTTRLDFGIGVSLEGQIRRKGLPVPGARLGLLRVVTWESSSAHRSTEISTAITGLDGRYSIAGLAKGEYSITIDEGTRLQTHLFQLTEEDVRTLDIDLDRFVLAGRVVDTSNDPIAAVRISATRTGMSAVRVEQSGMVGGRLVHVSSTERSTTVSDPGGSFELELAGPGQWQASATLQGYKGDGEVIQAGSNAPVNFVLERQAELHVWTEGPGGLDATGARVHELRKEASSGRALIIEQSPGATGQVVLRGAPETETWLFATHPSFAPSVITRAR
jgi:hypothetical protein